MVKSSFAFFVYVLHLFVAVSHSGCLYQSDCQSNYVCCSHQCIYGSSCVGRNCASQSDCASEEVCCDSDCRYGSDCNGSPCNADSDCGQFNLNCCDGTCQYNDCNDAAVLVQYLDHLSCFSCSLCVFPLLFVVEEHLIVAG